MIIKCCPSLLQLTLAESAIACWFIIFNTHLHHYILRAFKLSDVLRVKKKQYLSHNNYSSNVPYTTPTIYMKHIAWAMAQASPVLAIRVRL